jgi:hypothetical protein
MSFGIVEIYCHRSKTRSRTSSEPLFQMIGAFFAMFASDNQHIALMVNMTSVFQVHSILFFVFVFHDFEKLVSKFQPLVLMLTR